MHAQGEILRLFQDAGALREGHFVYKSGLHGDQYVNKSAVLMRPLITSYLCFKIGEKFKTANVETVITPAIGAIPMGTWMASYLTNTTNKEVFSAYAEKEQCDISESEGTDRRYFYNTGKFIIGRDFKKYVVGRNVLVLEDVLNTGSSAKAVVEAVQDIGGVVVGVGALCNRGNVTAKMLHVPKLVALLNLDLKTFTPEECAEKGPCSRGILINLDVGHGREFLIQQKKDSFCLKTYMAAIN